VKGNKGGGNFGKKKPVRKIIEIAAAVRPSFSGTGNLGKPSGDFTKNVRYWKNREERGGPLNRRIPSLGVLPKGLSRE